MRTLLLLRGAPGSGKSTYIEKNGLKPYTLSADDIRLLHGSPRLMPDGKNVISNKADSVVWKTLFDILEIRMQNGEFTVIDACNSKTSEIGRYRTLADKYRYRIFIVDFTDVPLERCIEQNKKRPEYNGFQMKLLKISIQDLQLKKYHQELKLLNPMNLMRLWRNQLIYLNIRK